MPTDEIKITPERLSGIERKAAEARATGIGDGGSAIVKLTVEDVEALCSAARQRNQMRLALNEIIGRDSSIDATPRGDAAGRPVAYGPYARIAKRGLPE